MENEAECAKDGPKPELINEATELNDSSTASADQAAKIDVVLEQKFIRNVPDSEERKFNHSNTTDDASQYEVSLTSSLNDTMDIFNNGFLTAKSPCNAENLGPVDGASNLEDSSNALSVHVARKELLPMDATHPEIAIKKLPEGNSSWTEKSTEDEVSIEVKEIIENIKEKVAESSSIKLPQEITIDHQYGINCAFTGIQTGETSDEPLKIKCVSLTQSGKKIRIDGCAEADCISKTKVLTEPPQSENTPNNVTRESRNTFIVDSTQEDTALNLSVYDEQTVTALLQEAIMDEILNTLECGITDQPRPQQDEPSENIDISATHIFVAAVNEISERKGILAALPNSETDELAKLKKRGEAFQKFFKIIEDQLSKTSED